VPPAPAGGEKGEAARAELPHFLHKSELCLCLAASLPVERVCQKGPIYHQGLEDPEQGGGHKVIEADPCIDLEVNKHLDGDEDEAENNPEEGVVLQGWSSKDDREGKEGDDDVKKGKGAFPDHSGSKGPCFMGVIEASHLHEEGVNGH